MPKRSVTTEIQIAALKFAIDRISIPERNRKWLVEPFAEEHIKSVRVTSDIVDAVEEQMNERLSRIAKILQAELDELTDDDDAEALRAVLAARG